MDSDDSSYIDSDTEAYLYSQIYHETQTPSSGDASNKRTEIGNDSVEKSTSGASQICDIKLEHDSTTKNNTSNKSLLWSTTCVAPKQWMPTNLTPSRFVYQRSPMWTTVSSSTSSNVTRTVSNVKPATVSSSSSANVTRNTSNVKPATVSSSTSANVKPATVSTSISAKAKRTTSYVIPAGFSYLSSTNVTRTTSDMKPAALSHVLPGSVSSPSLKATIHVIGEEELKAEKPNRKRPEKIELSVTSKMAKKSNISKKVKLDIKSESTSDSSDAAVRTWKDSEKQNVVINVGPTTSSCDTQMELRQEENPALWLINTRDRNKTQPTNRWLSVECYNCRERGHLSKFCTKPKRLDLCHLCGEPGHKSDSCLHPVCGKCLLPGHWQYQCHWSVKMSPPCALCGGIGHLCQECPSIWRRFHLTTTEGPLKKVSDYACQEKTTRYCYSCGREGHYGYACPKKRNHNIYPPNRVVSDYSDPRKIIYHKANLKLWRNRLTRCRPKGDNNNMPQVNINIGTVQPKKRKEMMKQQRAQNKLNKKRKKKELARNKGAVGDVVRVNPVMETNFPRSGKGKNMQGLTVTCWKGATGKKALKRTVCNNAALGR